MTSNSTINLEFADRKRTEMPGLHRIGALEIDLSQLAPLSEHGQGRAVLGEASWQHAFNLPKQDAKSSINSSPYPEIHDSIAQLAHLVFTGFQKKLDRYVGSHTKSSPKPLILGVSGSVSVGKSTFAEQLKACLSKLPPNPSVEIVSTDGFLKKNTELQRKGLFERKGFPESYDQKKVAVFLDQLANGRHTLSIPEYSHVIRDVLPLQRHAMMPDILILEGVNVLQNPRPLKEVGASQSFANALDYSFYLDAQEEDIRRWYVSRFIQLRRNTSGEVGSEDGSSCTDSCTGRLNQEALDTWSRVNLPNLKHHIFPTRMSADLILRKNSNHCLVEMHPKLSDTEFG